ncbi:hypothetical protein ACFU99_01440 [Streptomyces sp. NPDC057654]|uniref:MmyB family transcriptional regulator n=1 Tax=Streptomyces sp. NPDC057654 TaxID=3346196 RepID=UPI0036CD25F2
MDRNRVRQILATARQRLNADDLPRIAQLRMAHGLGPRNGSRGPRLVCPSQLEIDLLLGNGPSSRFYARLERGQVANPPDALLRAVAQVLDFQEHQWDDLYRALYGHRAPKVLRPESGLDIGPLWTPVILNTAIPAYISRSNWDVEAANPPAQELFGPMPANIMRWMLSLTPEEHSRSRMPDWEESWGPVALSQLRSALNDTPYDPTLRRIEAEVLEDAELRSIYQGYLDPRIHPDGTVRLMYHGTKGRIGVMRAAASEPMGSPGSRVIYMIWSG